MLIETRLPVSSDMPIITVLIFEQGVTDCHYVADKCIQQIAIVCTKTIKKSRLQSASLIPSQCAAIRCHFLLLL